MSHDLHKKVNTHVGHGYGGALIRFTAWIAMAISLLVMLPLAPYMPHSGLDESWGYALNMAVAHRLVFGRDLIFTFGPFGAVYSHVYHPSTDVLMLVGSALTGIGLICGFALLALKTRPALLLLLPALLVCAHSPDANFMILPFLFLLVTFVICTERDNRRLYFKSVEVLSLIVLSVAIGLLPLIKGSFSGVVGVLSLLAMIMLVRARYSTLALVLFLSMLLSMCVGWIGAGQPIAALPGFFWAQKPIIAGYSEAMSLSGAFWPVGIYLLCAAICICMFCFAALKRERFHGMVATIGLIFYFFITFKAGFVRQDAHVQMAAGALLLATLAIGTLLKPRTCLVLFILSLSTWWGVERSGENIHPRDVANYFHTAIGRVETGLLWRQHTTMLPTLFDRANQEIRDQFPFKPVDGSVDVYPTELSFVFAHGMNWSGRPVPQSYSAYATELDAADGRHLLGPTAPRNVFFRVAPIDYRLPSLEDASSWPILLSNYHVVSREHGYLHLMRNDATSTPDIRELASINAKLNEPIEVPRIDGPIMVKIAIQKTFAGRLLLSAFKLPEMFIEMTLDNGQVVTNRYIPDMGSIGFLVSPYIISTGDFLVLASGVSSLKPVRRIRIVASENGLRDSSIGVIFSTFSVRPSPTVQKMALPEAIPVPDISSSAAHPAAQCSLDFIDSIPSTGLQQEIALKPGPVSLFGWAAPSASNGIGPDRILAVLKAEDGSTRAFDLPISPRVDIKMVFGHRDMKDAGFDSSVDLRDFSGRQVLNIYTVRNGIFQSCNSAQKLVVGKS